MSCGLGWHAAAWWTQPPLPASELLLLILETVFGHLTEVCRLDGAA